MSEAYAEPYYKCVESDDEPYQYWEISLVKEDRVDYVDSIHPDDMGDWISHEMKKSKTYGVIDIKLITWDSFLQERYERQEERRNEAL